MGSKSLMNTKFLFKMLKNLENSDHLSLKNDNIFLVRSCSYSLARYPIVSQA